MKLKCYPESVTQDLCNIAVVGNNTNILNNPTKVDQFNYFPLSDYPMGIIAIQFIEWFKPKSTAYKRRKNLYLYSTAYFQPTNTK